PVVELLPAVLLHPGDGCCEVGLNEQLSLSERLIGTVQEDAGGLGELLHDGNLKVQDEFHAKGCGEAFLREEVRWLEAFFPAKLAELLMSESEARRCSRDSNRLVADVQFLRGNVRLGGCRCHP